MSKLRAGICSSMTVSVLEKLQSAGVINVVDFVSHDLDDLSTKSGVGYRELAAIRRVLISEHAAPVVVGSSMFDLVVATTSIVSLGCRVLDDLLEGGIFTGEITEVVTDRSDLSDALVMNTVLTVITAMSKNVVFIDTSNHFDVNRLAAMLANQTSVHVESALKQVRVVKCFDVFDLMSKLSAMCETPSLSNDSFYSSLKLVVIVGIVDCILPSISHVHSNAGCGYVAQVVRQFRVLSAEFGYAVLLSNGDVSKNNALPRLMSVGRIWHSLPDTRLDVTDITDESNEKCRAGNTAVCGRIKVMLSKSNRLPIGNSVELEFDEHGLFV